MLLIYTIECLIEYIQMRKYIVIFLFCFINTLIFSHPHMSFTSAIEFVFNDTKLKGAFVEWTFDRYFSADIISGYDLNHDDVFNASETEDVWQNAFSYTENYYYFCFIRQGKIRTSPDKVSSFSVKQKDGIISYRFYVDLSNFTDKELYFAVYDYTFYCDITYRKNNGVTFSYNNASLKPSYQILENKDYPVYYNPIGPINDTRIYYKWKPGLETYYPKEIAIKY
ncbi:MAG: DUF1007 family protein [Treponema sp.]